MITKEDLLRLVPDKNNYQSEIDIGYYEEGFEDGIDKVIDYVKNKVQALIEREGL